MLTAAGTARPSIFSQGLFGGLFSQDSVGIPAHVLGKTREDRVWPDLGSCLSEGDGIFTFK